MNINNREIEKKKIVKCIKEMKYEYCWNMLLEYLIDIRFTMKFTQRGGYGDYIRERVLINISYTGTDNIRRCKCFAVQNSPSDKYTHVAENILGQIESWGEDTFVKS